MNTKWIFEYPVWDIGYWGGGLLIAVIAILHVYIAHFAVGGGLFLVLTEKKGYKENSQSILDYTKQHAKFFLLASMVFGAISGVGIWFTISLLSPSATSTLVHFFAFGWATEWVFFLGEIITLFVYYYTFGKMEKRNHLLVGWLYFVFGWASLFIINGIITFMLTPGKWIQTGDFWDGFFNPTFMASLCFRTFMALMLAGLFGFLTSAWIKDDEFKETMVQYCAKWVLIPLIFAMISAGWYISDLPPDQKQMIFNQSPEIPLFLKAFVWISIAIFIGGLGMAFKKPLIIGKPFAIAMAFIGLLYIGSFEWIREAGRRPFILYAYEYSNSVHVKDVPLVLEKGVLSSARWVKHKEITETNVLEAGKEIYRLLCLSCHSIGGPMNDILPLTKKYSLVGMNSLLDGMGKILPYMPIFMGTEAERNALATYIVKGLHGKTELEKQLSVTPSETPTDVFPFQPETDDYILLAWTDFGNQFLSDCDKFFSFAAPGTYLNAVLIKRGQSPEIISDNVSLTYRIEENFDNPTQHVDFWKYSQSLMGTAQPAPSGSMIQGEMNYESKRNIFRGLVPVVPYTSQKKFHPYPIAIVEAKDKTSGSLLAATKTVVPISTEMGCKTCHGGTWKTDVAGISSDTATDILATHDRINKTQLLKLAKNGKPKACFECHESNIHGSGKENHLSLSASMHGFHANYMTNKGANACATCHPSEGFTKGFRGIHLDVGLDCTSCHGKLEDHAISLLKKEQQEGKKRADLLLAYLKPKNAASKDEISPRKAWKNQPDCLNCHVDFNPPETDTGSLSQWTESEAHLYRNRSDEAGIMCAACHGAPHAEYPASNPFGTDNLPPRQYQNDPYPIGSNKNCQVCHRKEMDDPIHHPNMLNMFRNTK